MYRLLEVGEVIEKGDEIWSDKKGWFSAELSIGENVPTWAAPMRRLVNPAVTPAASSVPDPGEGWRLLTEGETIIEGDEQIDTKVMRFGWSRTIGLDGESVDNYQPRFQFRRRIEKPAPVVSVGDRVKVLSGPWAGCTGVVIGSLPMNLKIKMDNVFVGGNSLTMIVGKVAVEPLPPVVPEVLYRDLSHGETIRKGDEFWRFGIGPWQTINEGSTLIGGELDKSRARHRRAVRVQSAGWRYLDAGETVQAGDEIQTTLSGKWDSVSSSAGTKVGDNQSDGRIYFFRRKLPANQGG